MFQSNLRPCLLLTVVLASALPALVNSQINYFGVGFSPYVRSDGAYWNSYTLDDVKQMLRIVLNGHNAIATYSMGVSQWNNGQPWDKADSNCLVARASAQINKERNSVVLSVSQGIFQQDDPSLQQREIDNAFSAAADANAIFPGTVQNMVFTNEFVTDNSNGPRVLQMIRDNKQKAHSRGLRVGTRIHTCGEIWGGPNQNIIKQIVRESDFIMCNLYPALNSNNPDVAAQGVRSAYYSARDGFWRENPKIEVMIGETGWSSSGANFFNQGDAAKYNTVDNLKKFWGAIKAFANTDKVKIYMFEAFDEPWKTGLPGEKTFGWWKRADDNSKYYIEKSTGRRFD